MPEHDSQAAEFAAHRAHLHAVAKRMLGSHSEADDAVQEAWIRYGRADVREVGNLRGWLTRVVSRVCLDLLRARTARRLSEAPAPEPALTGDDERYPGQPRELGDSLGAALQVVQTLAPAERVAFVLHDLFELPFDEIAAIVERSPAATRQLASRARRRVSGVAMPQDPDLAAQRRVVDAFLVAARGGDLQALLAVLAPEVVFQADAAGVRNGSPPELRGHQAVARNFSGRAQAAHPARIDGALGLVVDIGGRRIAVLRLTIVDDRIVDIDALGDPQAIADLDIEVLPD